MICSCCHFSLLVLVENQLRFKPIHCPLYMMPSAYSPVKGIKNSTAFDVENHFAIGLELKVPERSASPAVAIYFLTYLLFLVAAGCPVFMVMFSGVVILQHEKMANPCKHQRKQQGWNNTGKRERS